MEQVIAERLSIDDVEELAPAGRLLAAIGVGAALVDRDHRMVWANELVRDRAGDRCGGSPAGLRCFAALWRRDERCPDCLPLLVFRTGEPQEGLRERGRPGGPVEVFRVCALPVFDRAGELRFALETFVKVSGLTPALARARGASPFFDAAGPSPGAAFMLVDTLDRIVSWSPAAGAILGYALDEVLGRRVDLLIPPERTFEKRMLMERVERDGRVARFETVRRAKDGRAVPVAITAAALRDESGKLVGRSTVLEDLSALRSLRSELEARERFFAHMIRDAADPIVGLALDGRVTSWNRAAEEVFGFAAAEVLGRSLARLCGEDGLAMLVELARGSGPARASARAPERGDGAPSPEGSDGARRAESARGLRMTWRSAGEKPVPVELSTALLRDGAGAPVEMGLLVRDLSAAQRLERKIMRAEKLATVGSLAAGLAHEIGTPLNVISASAEYLLPDSAEGSPQREQLSVIVSETDRIARLVRELLAFARTAPRAREEVRLDEVVSRVLRLIQVPLEKRRVRIQAELPPDLPAVLFDRDELHQLLLNLLLNAVAAVAEGGCVGVRARADGAETVVLEVHDDGPGVPKELRERIFDPFFTTRPDGTGLGLAVCARIISACGGDVSVGTGPLGGASFVVTLPVSAAGASAAPPGGAP